MMTTFQMKQPKQMTRDQVLEEIEVKLSYLRFNTAMGIEMWGDDVGAKMFLDDLKLFEAIKELLNGQVT